MPPRVVTTSTFMAEHIDDGAPAAGGILSAISHKIKDYVPRSSCYKEGCQKVSLSYGPPGGDKISCKGHGKNVAEFVCQSGKCSFRGCDKRGHHKLCGTTFYFCASHRDELIEGGLPFKRAKSYHATCIAPGCDVSATFDEKKYCGQHSPTKNSDDRRKCNFPGCTKKRPTFGFDGEQRTRCKDHREEGMFSHKLCVVTGCDTGASYGDRGGVATHCKAHCPKNHVLKAATCAEEGCTHQPSFGPTGGTIYTHCSFHKLEGYVDLRNKRCAHEGCDKNQSFGLVGGERKWCFEHKTDQCVNLVETICCMSCCGNEGLQAAHYHPDHQVESSEFYGRRVCHFAKRVLIEDALMKNDMQRVEQLLQHFKVERVVTLNAQSAFRFECEKLYYEDLQQCVDIVFDQPIKPGVKFLGDKRPDIFYKFFFHGRNFGIHIEYDETTSHEQDDARLQWIADEAGCLGRVYVIRVHGKHGTESTLCERVRAKHFEYYKTTVQGKKVALSVAQAVKERIAWVKSGLMPDDNANRKYKVLL